MPGNSEKLKRAGAAIAVTATSAAFYAIAPYNAAAITHVYAAPSFSFSGGEFLLFATCVYSFAIAAFHAIATGSGTTKSLQVVRWLWRALRSPRHTLRRGIDPDDRVALLTTLLKSFFGPLMAMSLMQFCVGTFQHGLGLWAAMGSGTGFLRVFNEHGFWVLMQFFLFVDVFFFTVGYLIEAPRLGNHIRSVDPTLLGWAAALACYPPFNSLTGAVLGSAVSDFPKFDDPGVHVVLNGVVLALMAVYASASVALGLKASNLTHRGIVARGPYSFVRHPAYTCKNLAWWIGAAPLVSAAFSESLFSGASAVASVIAWSLLYVLRAITEEDHLRSVDGEYVAYAAKVRHRFIPGIY